MTKARVSVAAAAMAKVSSGGEEPPTSTLWTWIGCASRLISGSAMSRFSPASLANEVTCAERLAQRPFRQRRFERFEDVGARLQPEDVDRPREHRQVAALDHQVQVLAAFDRDPLGDRQVRLGEQGSDLVVGRARLQRVRFVDDHFDFRRARREGRERVDLVDQVFGQDQRREDVARFDLVDRFVTGVHRDAFDFVADALLNVGGRELGAAEADPRVFGDFVEEGDPRRFRPARDREADQHRDQHRVEDEQHRLQRRAAEDLQVLEQQPAHVSGPGAGGR